MTDLEKLAKRAVPYGMEEILVLKNGQEAGRYQTVPQARRDMYSVSKSFTSFAVGKAIEEGLLSLNDRVVDMFPDKLPPIVNDNLKNLKLKNLITMSVGQNMPNLMGPQRRSMTETDWISHALSRPYVDMPGTTFMYNNVGPYLAGCMVEKVTGMSMKDYLVPRLFEPLGIPDVEWGTDPEGHTFGAALLKLDIDEMARFGQMYLQGGVYAGKRLINSEWVRESGRKQIDNAQWALERISNEWYAPVPEELDSAVGYGYCFWRCKSGCYRADGKYGQYIIVCEQKNAVIAICSKSEHTQKILDAVWEEVLPQL